MKAFTDINQSKKLAEILPIDSADMYYPYDLDANKLLSIPIVKDDYSMPCIHCWSLAALLEILRKKDRFPEINEKAKDDFILKTYIWDGKTSIQFSEGDTLVDACYELILKLYKHKLLKEH